MPKIGLREGMLTKRGADFVDEAAELGSGVVEALLRPGEESGAWGGSEGRLAYRERAARRGVPIASICLGFLNALPLGGQGARAERALALLDAGIDWAVDLGAEAILVPFFGLATLRTPDDAERLATRIRRLAPKAEAAGVTLGLESTLSAREVLALLKAIDSPRVGCYWDTGNSVAQGADPAEEIRLLGARIVRVHLKDRMRTGADRMLGEGQVNFPQVAFELRRSGYRGPLVLETPKGSDAVEAARRNLAFAHGVFQAERSFL
ncbi:MAG: sugar phosphate isomerase/epimerase [Planctomycetes bacterium]|nr:sugar phosphate isomerase/epimerase [Planctomycetota bacterium]